MPDERVQVRGHRIGHAHKPRHLDRDASTGRLERLVDREQERAERRDQLARADRIVQLIGARRCGDKVAVQVLRTSALQRANGGPAPLRRRTFGRPDCSCISSRSTRRARREQQPNSALVALPCQTARAEPGAPSARRKPARSRHVGPQRGERAPVDALVGHAEGYRARTLVRGRSSQYAAATEA